MRPNPLRATAALLLCLASNTPHAFGQDSLWKAKSPFLKCVQTAANLEPAIPHPSWEEEATAKLAALQNKVGRKPNILIFIVDDMGWGDPGCYGGGAAVGAPTPNIDDLAAHGMKMTSAYSQPSCTPTRAALLTGRLPQRSGLTRPTAAGELTKGIESEVVSAALLAKAGYMTGMAGKWHLGEEKGQRPTDVGFDEYYGNLGANTTYHDFRDPEISPELVYKAERAAQMDKVAFIRHTVRMKKGDADVTLDQEINLQTEPLLEEKYLAWSQDFIQRANAAKKPFFLYHSMNRVHTKNYPNPRFRGKSPAGTPYKDGMLEVDWVLGEIVKTLKEQGQLENTFIYCTSDNGPEEDVMANALIFTSDAGHTPFRGAKGTTLEGGVRVSGIAHWPGMIKAGRVSDGLFDLMDLYNTAVRLGGAGESIPRDRYVDGIDQTSWLLTDQDDNQESSRETVFHWYGPDFYGSRWKEFKRVEQINIYPMNDGPGVFGGITNTAKLEVTDPTLGWFFNLYQDPKERIPTAKTWVVAPTVELTVRHKMTFLQFPQAPRGVNIGGYLIGGPAGGTLPEGFQLGTPSPEALPD
ncbi:MAG: sulfatase-like hydrolase/transferase [Phycisphaerae bacterium]|nr:sulfatase-like hydrolase/transferase [Phycisphaerae bacterium]